MADQPDRRAPKEHDERQRTDVRLQTVLRRQRPIPCRVDVVVFRSTFKRGNTPRGEAPAPVFTVPQPRHEPAEAPQPPRAEEPEARRDVQQYQRDTHASTGGDLNASLGKGSEFEGKLAFEGKVRIDGTFTGEISTNDTLHIGEGAKVSAEISCGTVIVEGDVVGNIKATGAVELHRPAKVRGDITSPSLSIEKGVIFEGRSKMESIEGSNVVNLRAAADEA
jgi:cytoskeletal protein CcmA (bactofilin family)